MLKNIRKLLKWLFSLGIIVFLIAIWAVSTEKGLNTLFYFAKPLIPGAITIEKLEGSFVNMITIEEMLYQHPEYSLTAKKICFKCDWLALFQGKLHFPHIYQLENVEFSSARLKKNIMMLHQQEEGNGQTIHWQYTQENHPSLDPLKMQGTLELLQNQCNIQGNVIWGKKNIGSLAGFVKIGNVNVNVNVNADAKTQKKLLLETPLTGVLELKWVDLSPLYYFIPSISRIKGTAAVNSEIQGTLKNPIISFNANTHNTSFTLPKQRVNVKQFHLNISGILNQNWRVLGEGVIASKPFTLHGNLDFRKPIPGEFYFQGKSLRVFNTANIKIIASPELKLEYVDNTLAIKGKVEVEEGNITLKKALDNVIVSNDVIYLEGATTEIPSLIKIIPEIQLIFNDHIHFKGYGLDANVGGKLYIEQRKDKLYTGQGRIVLREGKYHLQNGAGVIRRGYLYFPKGTLLQDPILDIRVLQKAKDKLNESEEVGVYVQGSLQKPIYHLYSSEPLKQNEILSKLGFGGRQSAGEDDQRKMLSQTAVLLGGGTNPLMEDIQTRFGLEEFGIQSGNASQFVTTQEGYDAMLVVGKSLSDRFYLQFMQGMLVPSSTLKLQYFITPYIAISGETSTTGLGADVSFSVLRD